MYTRYARAPASYTRQYVEDMKKDFSLDIDNRTAKKLYEERTRLLEILNICLDLSTYLLALSLRATTKIDRRAHLHVNDDLVGYGRDAMQEMLVIRLKDLFYTKKDKPEEFRFHGFHQSLYGLGVQYPRPNVETNNTIARIIKRRNFYSAHHGNGKKEFSFERNRLQSLDLVTAITYIAKVEESLYGGKVFDPFERLLNDELDVDRPLVLCGVYEVVAGQDYEVLNYTEVLETLPNGDQVVDGEYEDTPGFAAYQSKAKKELQRIREKVNKIIGY